MVSVGGLGGTERIATSLSNSLAKRGHQIELICPRQGWVTETLRDSDVKVRVERFHGLRRSWTALKLGIQLRRQRVDVIHAHLSRSARVAHVASLISRTPMLVTVHTDLASEVYLRIARGDNRIVAVSRYLEQRLQSWGVSKENIRVVHNGTDFHLRPKTNRDCLLEKLGFPVDCQLAGFIGRVQKAKGCMFLVDAVADLAAAHPKLRLLMVGVDHDETSQGIHERVIARGIADRVVFTGGCTDIIPILDAIDVLIAPSQMETFGLAALEAMARAKPVIASKVGGLPEVVQHGETGLLVERSTEQLRVALESMLNRPDEARCMGFSGFDRVMEQFTLERMTSEYEQVYGSLCKRN